MDLIARTSFLYIYDVFFDVLYDYISVIFKPVTIIDSFEMRS